MQHRNLAGSHDAPDVQAVFRFSMVAPQGQTVLFNMPETGTTPLADGTVEHSFQGTPLMSTYLVAFIVGDLTAVTTTVSGRTFKVWGTPERCAVSAGHASAALSPVWLCLIACSWCQWCANICMQMLPLDCQVCHESMGKKCATRRVQGVGLPSRDAFAIGKDINGAVGSDKRSRS